MKRKTLIFILIISLLFVGVTVSAKELNFNILTQGSTTSCTGYFGSPDDEGSLMNLLVDIFRLIQVLVPILLLALTTFDFAMVVFNDSKDGMSKAKSKFIKRAIIAVVIFFIPWILQLILQYVNNQSINSCLNKFN